MASSQGQEKNMQNTNDPKINYEMTPEERQVLKECENESFVYRAFPMASAGFIGTHFLVKTGRLTAHPKFGSFPKAFITSFLGYIAGKASYLPVCRQKIIERVPHGMLAERIQGNSKNQLYESSKVAGSQPSSSDVTKSDDYSSFNQSPSFSTEMPAAAEELDDRFRPSVDREVKKDDPAGEGQKKITYDDMRRRNRQQYEEGIANQPPKQPGSYENSPFMPQRPFPDKAMKPESDVVPAPPPQSPPKRKRTNIWGDAIDN